MFQHYLMFSGDCEEALKTYEKAFGGKITELCRYGEMEGYADEATKNLIMHSTFVLGSGNIMCADYPHKATTGDNMFVMPPFENSEALKKAWEVLKADGKIIEDLCEPFYAELYGCLVDKYGINWMLMIAKK
ncbi:MAG: VOC family protein [Firmicutes bacterium]|nr:VOC family protein [Bacillota bacterium]